VSAQELIRAIERAGGSLRVSGDRLRYSVPRDAAHLIPALRIQKPAVITILRQRAVGELPWLGYNGGKQFACDLCGVRFDTSVGIAKHKVNGCHAKAE
jgi:hypothetical protein